MQRRVIKTKSVEFMPFTLSFFLTLCATMWFFYGFFVKDMFIAVSEYAIIIIPSALTHQFSANSKRSCFLSAEQLPNVLGFLFGITQMTLYMIYKNAKKEIIPTKQQQHEDPKLCSMDSRVLGPTVTEPKLTEMKIVLDSSSRPAGSNGNNV